MYSYEGYHTCICGGMLSQRVACNYDFYYYDPVYVVTSTLSGLPLAALALAFALVFARYIFLGSVQFGQHYWITYISGGFMILAGVLCIIVARHAVGKLNKLHAAVVQGHATDPEFMRATFAKYDEDNNGTFQGRRRGCARARGGGGVSG